MGTVFKLPIVRLDDLSRDLARLMDPDCQARGATTDCRKYAAVDIRVERLPQDLDARETSGEHLAKFVELILSNVVLVERALRHASPRVCDPAIGRRAQEYAGRREHACHLGHERAVVFHVLDRLERYRQVEAGGGSGQRPTVRNFEAECRAVVLPVR